MSGHQKPVYSIEKVSPERAYEWLTESGGNRSYREADVAALASAMRRGDWKVGNDAITFDWNGKLVNGHHRLTAVIFSDCTVEMGILRNVDPAARDVMDTGNSRNLGDILRFANTQNGDVLGSYLRGCARLVSGTNVIIKTQSAYDAWLPFFKAGIDAYFELGAWKAVHMRNQKVAGPLIVAYKLNPDAIAKFIVALRDGTELRSNSPALVLREFLMAEVSGGNRSRQQPFDLVASKVFACAKAFIEGRTLGKIQASEGAAEYFRSAYARGNIAKLIAETRSTRSDARRTLSHIKVTPTGVELPSLKDLQATLNDRKAKGGES